MPAAEAQLYFYDITKAGYYKRGTEDLVVCGISETLESLSKWIRRDARPLSGTATFKPGPNSRLMPAYCAGIEQDVATGDFLVTMWNETETVDGEFASISDQPVGQAVVHLTDVPPGTIPGFATYFWILPKLRRYAVVQLRQSRNGRAEFDYYLKSYLSKFTNHVIYDDGGNPNYFSEIDERVILRYDPGNGSTDSSPLVPQWASQRVTKPGPIEYIRNNRDQIRKIVRKNELSAAVKLDRGWFHSFLRFLANEKHERSESIAETVRIKLEMDFTPSEDELEAMVVDWETTREDGSGWNDVGFEFRSNQTTYWLSHAIPKATLLLDIEGRGQGIVDGRSLLAGLTAMRRTALEGLPPI